MAERDTHASCVTSPWLTQPQAARYLQMDVKELRKLVAVEEIESRRRGERVFIHTAWLDTYMLKLPSGAKVPEILQS